MRTSNPPRGEGSFLQTFSADLNRLAVDNAHTLLCWGAVTGVALLAALLAPDTGDRQLAIGIVLSSATLLVLLALCELVFRIVDIAVAGFRRR